MRLTQRARPHRLLLALAPLLAVLPCHAQFKVVGPDGKVTYTDRPAEGAAGKPVDVGNTATPETALPYELRQAASRYPVTYYTTAKCTPCDAGRNWLRTRGIPFAEKSISTREENEALTRSVGSAELPAMTIGTQPVRGFGAEQWNALFDAAGYPRASQLPRTYKYAAATPLIPPPAAEPPQASAPEAPPAAAPTAPTPANPAGIKF
jgi:glutaredoxin